MKQIKQIMIIFVMCAFSLVSIGGTAHASLLGDIIGGINALGGAPNGYVVISGKVVNREQEPLVGVLVSYSQDRTGKIVNVMTDENGNYSVKVPKSQDGSLTFKLENYRTIIHNIYPVSDDVISKVMHFDSITGKVMDSAGYPIEGAALSFEKDGGRSGILTVYTDENGNYEVHIPEDGKDYWVTVKCDGYDVLRKIIYGTGGDVQNFTLR